jgi:hypothetical protein
MILAAGAVLAAGTARADFDPEAWSHFREIRVAEDAAGDHARLLLDDAVWDESAGADLADLRILRGQTDDIGYVVYVPEGRPPRIQERRARVYDIARQGDRASELKIDLGDSPPIANRLRIETDARDFGCAVTVEGSDDGKTWKTLRDDAAIFDFGGDIGRRFTTVALPDTRMRYLHVTVAAPPNGKPIDLKGATVFQEQPAQESDLPALADRPVKKRTEAAQMRETWHTLDLGARHLSVSRLAFETPQENFSRPVAVEVSDDGKAWSGAGGGMIFRFRTDRYREERLTVNLPEAFGRYVRVKVADGDDPPLAVTRVSVLGRPRYVYFPFQKGQAYRLYYGNAQAHPAQYEYAKVFAHVDRAAAIEARLGDPQTNPRFIATRAAEPAPPWVERNQWVLYVALGVAVVGLGLVALRALRRTEADPPPA